jgi:hypothetical protein
MGDITTQPARRMVKPLPLLIGSGLRPRPFARDVEPFEVRPVITSDTGDHLARTPPSRAGLDVMYPRTNDDGSPSQDRTPTRFLTSRRGQFEVRPGTPVISWSDGTVSRVARDSHGRIVEVDHGEGFVTVYRHLASVVVERGQQVGASQTLGIVGVDPVEGFVPHLHTEGKLDGKALDMEFLFIAAPAVEADTAIGLIPILSAAGIRGALAAAVRQRQVTVILVVLFLLWWFSKRRT